MNEALLYTISDKQHLALTTNSQASEYSINATNPYVTSASAPSGDGYFTMGSNGIFAPNRAMLMPFGEGEPGQQFTMALYYLNHVGDSPSTWIWSTALLVELLCTLGDLCFPKATAGQSNGRLVESTNYLCQSIQLLRGSLGKDGDINTDTGFPAFALCAINGARFIGFDFKRVDENVTMNALWSRA